MTPSEWLKTASLTGSGLSDSDRLLLSRLGTYDEDALWKLLVWLSACFSDLAKGGAINSLPANMDLLTVAATFTHLSSTMVDAAHRLSGSGSGSLALQGSQITIPEEGL